MGIQSLTSFCCGLVLRSLAASKRSVLLHCPCPGLNIIIYTSSTGNSALLPAQLLSAPAAGAL